MIVSALGGVAALSALVRRRYVQARVAAVAATAAVLWGWGAGQYPHTLEPAARVDDYAASTPVLVALGHRALACGREGRNILRDHGLVGPW